VLPRVKTSCYFRRWAGDSRIAIWDDSRARTGKLSKHPIARIVPEKQLAKLDEERADKDVVESSAPDGPEAPVTSVSELRRQAYLAALPRASRRSVNAEKTVYQRADPIRRYVLTRSKGIREGCRKPAPFVRKSGTPYLEPYHTRRVSDGGPDHPRWVAALCPCIAKSTLVSDAPTRTSVSRITLERSSRWTSRLEHPTLVT
jgi:hypothetical protein